MDDASGTVHGASVGRGDGVELRGGAKLNVSLANTLSKKTIPADTQKLKIDKIMVISIKGVVFIWILDLVHILTYRFYVNKTSHLVRTILVILIALSASWLYYIDYN